MLRTLGGAWVASCLLFFMALTSQGSEGAAHKEKTLIQGLDGGSYEPYSTALIKKVQQALKSEGLYEGEIDGVLDQETMDALGEFQKRHGLHVSGVPSPKTRKQLLEKMPSPT